MYTRRDFGKLTLATLPAALASAKISSKIHGVQIGVATYSYSTLPRDGILDTIIQSMTDCGIGECLLLLSQTDRADLVEKARPARGGAAAGGGGRGASGGLGRAGGANGGSGRGAGRGPATPEQAAAAEELRQWRLNVPMSYYEAIRKKFTDAGLEISAIDAGAGGATDADLSRTCEIVKVLGARYMMCTAPRSVAKRLGPIAEKAGMKVGFQGRPYMATPTDPDIMTKPADFAEAVRYSKNFGTSIDVGDATWGGWDVLKFIQDTHPRIFALNMKDRTKAGTSMPWGQGDARVGDILKLVRDRKYPIRCNIDCDHATAEGGSRLADIKRCMEFAKSALA